MDQDTERLVDASGAAASGGQQPHNEKPYMVSQRWSPVTGWCMDRHHCVLQPARQSPPSSSPHLHDRHLLLALPHQLDLAQVKGNAHGLQKVSVSGGQTPYKCMALVCCLLGTSTFRTTGWRVCTYACMPPPPLPAPRVFAGTTNVGAHVLVPSMHTRLHGTWPRRPTRNMHAYTPGMRQQRPWRCRWCPS